MDIHERLDRHGRSIDMQGLRLDRAEADVEKLWKFKVSVERYIWIERIVMAGCGAVLLWVIQLVLNAPKS